MRFLATGAFNTLFGYVVFAALILLVPQLHYTISLVLAYVIAVLVAYVLYRRLVFKVSGRFFRDLPRFVSVSLLALGLNLVLLPLLVAVGRVPVLLAQWLVVAVTAIASYIGHKHFSFRRPASPGQRASSSS